MSSPRLPDTLEERLERMAESTGTSKSRIICDALERYLDEFESRRTPFDLGSTFSVLQKAGGKTSPPPTRIF